MSLAASKRASIAVVAACQVMAMALWFSASAVVPQLVAEFRLSGFMQSALTSGVQLGFVAGCLASAFLSLADRLELRRFFAASALLGAAANALLLVVDPASAWMPALRFVTGMAMAGVYPVGMKLASTWAQGDMGLMVGILVGALTLGSASPHLFNAFSGVGWRLPVAVASLTALAATKRLSSRRSARPRTAETRQPATKPSCTPLVNAACMNPVRRNSAVSCGTTAEAENQSAIASIWDSARAAIDARLEAATMASSYRSRDRSGIVVAVDGATRREARFDLRPRPDAPECNGAWAG